jgi:hypothetical protein
MTSGYLCLGETGRHGRAQRLTFARGRSTPVWRRSNVGE